MSIAIGIKENMLKCPNCEKLKKLIKIVIEVQDEYWEHQPDCKGGSDCALYCKKITPYMTMTNVKSVGNRRERANERSVN